MLFEPILSIVDGAEGKRLAGGCQCRFSVQTLHSDATQSLDRSPFRVCRLPPAETQ